MSSATGPGVWTVGVWTIVVAGGSGRRFGSMKQFEPLDTSGTRIIDVAVRAAAAFGPVVLVVPAADVDEVSAGFAGESGAVRVAAGGDSRTASVRNGLALVPDDAEVICVHDAARPFATAEMFRAVIAAVRSGAAGAVPAMPVTDTVKVVDADGCVVETPPRDRLVAVQTPQAFRADVLRTAHHRAAGAGHGGTDDASLVEWLAELTADTELRVVVVPGEATNRKVTHRDDLDWARTEWARRSGGHGGAPGTEQ